MTGKMAILLLLILSGMSIFTLGWIIGKHASKEFNIIGVFWIWLTEVSGVLAAFATVMGAIVAFKAYGSWKMQMTHKDLYESHKKMLENINKIHNIIKSTAITDVYIIESILDDAKIMYRESGDLEYALNRRWFDARDALHDIFSGGKINNFVSMDIVPLSKDPFGNRSSQLCELISEYCTLAISYSLSINRFCACSLVKAIERHEVTNNLGTRTILFDLSYEGKIFKEMECKLVEIQKELSHIWFR